MAMKQTKTLQTRGIHITTVTIGSWIDCVFVRVRVCARARARVSAYVGVQQTREFILTSADIDG